MFQEASQESDSLWLVFGPPSHLPLLLAHLSRGPPAEPAVEMSEEHLEEKHSVCGWALPSSEQLSDVSEPVEWRLHYYGYYDSSPSPVNVSKAVWNPCMPLAFENAPKNVNMWAVVIFIPVHLNFWPFFHSLFSNLFFSFLHFIETIAFTLLSFCQSFVAANIFGGFHKMCECQTRLKGSPGSPEDFKQVCCQSWWDLRWCQESWEAQLVLLRPLPGCLWRNQGILWWWPAWD